MDTAVKKTCNAFDLIKLSESGRYELIKGVVHKMSPSGERHGVIASRIIQIVGRFVAENKSGITTSSETGYKLFSEPDTVRAPDMAFKSNERLSLHEITDGYSTVMPDLVVEVNSPGDRYSKIVEKVNDWLKAGVREVWVVDPQDYTVIVYKGCSGNAIILNIDDEITGGDILPGFKCDVRKLLYIM